MAAHAFDYCIRPFMPHQQTHDAGYFIEKRLILLTILGVDNPRSGGLTCSTSKEPTGLPQYGRGAEKARHTVSL